MHLAFAFLALAGAFRLGWWYRGAVPPVALAVIATIALVAGLAITIPKRARSRYNPWSFWQSLLALVANALLSAALIVVVVCVSYAFVAVVSEPDPADIPGSGVVWVGSGPKDPFGPLVMTGVLLGSVLGFAFLSYVVTIALDEFAQLQQRMFFGEPDLDSMLSRPPTSEFALVFDVCAPSAVERALENASVDALRAISGRLPTPYLGPHRDAIRAARERIDSHDRLRSLLRDPSDPDLQSCIETFEKSEFTAALQELTPRQRGRVAELLGNAYSGKHAEAIAQVRSQ